MNGTFLELSTQVRLRLTCVFAGREPRGDVHIVWCTGLQYGP